MKHDSEVEKNVFNILTEKRISFEVIEHEAVFTSDIAAKLAGYDINEGIKSIIMKLSPSGEFVLACVPGGKRIDYKKMRFLTSAKKIRFATAEEVKELTSLTIGSCCPFGYNITIKTFIDKDLYSKEYLYFNPGSHTKTIKLKSSDFKKIVKGIEF